jgi:hypothetical protein
MRGADLTRLGRQLATLSRNGRGAVLQGFLRVDLQRDVVAVGVDGGNGQGALQVDVAGGFVRATYVVFYHVMMGIGTGLADAGRGGEAVDLLAILQNLQFPFDRLRLRALRKGAERRGDRSAEQQRCRVVFQHVCFSPDPLLRLGHGPFDPGSLFLASISDTDPLRAFSSDMFPKATRANAKTAAISCVPPNPAMRRASHWISAG